MKGEKPCLLGGDWLDIFKLNWDSIFALSESSSTDSLTKLTKLSEEYRHLFRTIGTPGVPIKGFKATIGVKEDAKPIFCKARPVP
jgi:hypothetical protein